LHDFLVTLQRALVSRLPATSAEAALSGRIFAALDISAAASSPVSTRHSDWLPVCDRLQPLVEELVQSNGLNG